MRCRWALSSERRQEPGAVLGQQESWGRERPGPWKAPWAHLPEGQHGHLQPLPGLAQAARTSWEFTGHHLSCLFSLERRQEMLLHREELFLHKPYQEICVLKVLSVAEMNFPACYNMVVHLPAVILEFGNLNVKLVDLVLIGAVINTENFH